MPEHHGHHIHYVDPNGIHYEALVLIFHGNPTSKPCVDLIYVNNHGTEGRAYASYGPDGAHNSYHFPHDRIQRPIAKPEGGE
jgi:hypothetical protein